MSDVQRLLVGGIESPPVGNEDVIYRRRTAPSDGRQGEAPTLSNSPNDLAWAIAFKINVAITVISAVYYHKTALSALEDLLAPIGLQSYGGESGLRSLVFACMLAVPSTYAFSWVLLLMMSTLSMTIIQISAGLNVLGSAVIAAVLAHFGALLWAALAAGYAGTMALLLLRQGRVGFAAANFKVAVLAVKSTPRIMSWALCTTAFRLIWFVVAGIASFGSSIAFQTVLAPDGGTYYAADCHTVTSSASAPLSCKCNGNVISDTYGCESTSSNPVMACFWVASAGWSMNTALNVVSATVASSVTTWWASPDDVGSAWVSFHRVLHSSLGSVSKATLINSLILTLDSVSSYFMLVIPAVSCPLACVRYVTAYMVDNTAIVIGMYTLSFSEAVHRTWALFRKHGLTLYFNDTALVVGLSLIISAVLAIAAAFSVLAVMLLSHSSGIVKLICIAGVLAITTTLEVVIWAFRAVYICFLQDPEAFSTSHDRRLYDSMYRAWREMKIPHPTLPDEQGGIEV